MILSLRQTILDEYHTLNCTYLHLGGFVSENGTSTVLTNQTDQNAHELEAKNLLEVFQYVYFMPHWTLHHREGGDRESKAKARFLNRERAALNQHQDS